MILVNKYIKNIRNDDKNLYIFFAYKNMSLSDLLKRANMQQTQMEIKVEPKK